MSQSRGNSADGSGSTKQFFQSTSLLTEMNTWWLLQASEGRKAVYATLGVKEKPKRILRVAAGKNWFPGNSIQQEQGSCMNRTGYSQIHTDTVWKKKKSIASPNCLSTWKRITIKTEDMKWAVNIIYSISKRFSWIPSTRGYYLNKQIQKAQANKKQQ